jgi:hypothetical protein
MHDTITSPAASAGAALWQWLDGRDTARMNRYRTYLAFYEGEQWDERRRAGERRLTVNYARALVRKSASYLMPRPVTFDVGEASSLTLPRAQRAPGGREPEKDQQANASSLFHPSLEFEGGARGGSRPALAEAALNHVYAELDLHTLDFQSAVDSAVLGDGAFKVGWSAAERRPVVAAVDPQGIWAWWRADDPSVLTRVVQRYELERDVAREMFGEGNRLPVTGDREGPAHSSVFTTHHELPTTTYSRVVEDWRVDRYRVEVDGVVVRDEANAYGWIPFVIYPNLARPHELWGASDLEDLIEVCRELNRRMTTLSRILEVAGYPITVLENVTGSEGIRVDAGAVWELPEASRAYLLDMLSGGGVRLHIDYIELLYRQLHDLSETPRTAFGDSGRSLSGVALEVEIQPLVQKVMRKRRTWEMVYRRRNAMILDLLERFGGVQLGGLRQTRAVWSEVLPSDREALVRSEARLVASGIHSRRDAMSALGDADPEASWRRVLEERGEVAGDRLQVEGGE